MAAIAVEPLYMSNCTFSVAADSYEAALSGVVLTPSTPSSSWTGLAAGAVFTKNGKATWMCALTYVQDWSTAASLANYLHANEGNSIVVDFIPDVNDTGSPTISATLIVAPGAIGGKVNAFAETTVNLACQGKPTISLDTVAPTPGTIASSAITTTGFTLTLSGASDETALAAQPYAFSTDNGVTWSAFQSSNVFVATGKTTGTGYTCLGRVRDAAGNTADTPSLLVTTS